MKIFYVDTIILVNCGMTNLPLKFKLVFSIYKVTLTTVSTLKTTCFYKELC